MLLLLLSLIKIILMTVCVMISVAFITLLERKVLSLVGLRVGPNKVSLSGFLQPITDAVKLSNKQINTLSNFSFFFYYVSSFFVLLMGLTIWFCFPAEPSPLILKFSIVALFVVLGFNSYNSILCGWSSFSKYSLIGSLRTVSQLVSYEASLYLCLFFFIYFFYSFSFYNFFFLPLHFVSLVVPILLIIWIPSFLADLNRTPYDFSEGESELVSGFNTEFGSSSFTLIFLAEYSNIIFFSLLTPFLFFVHNFSIFFFFFFFFVIWIRSVLPRFRYDKLMMLCWKFFIPFLTFFFLYFLFTIL